jgi:hypothetical protein
LHTPLIGSRREQFAPGLRVTFHSSYAIYYLRRVASAPGQERAANVPVEPETLAAMAWRSTMSLHVGNTAPNFQIATSAGDIDFHRWAGESRVFFSQPADFTPV